MFSGSKYAPTGLSPQLGTYFCSVSHAVETETQRQKERRRKHFKESLEYHDLAVGLLSPALQDRK